MLPVADLAAALPSAKLRTLHGPWSRAVGYRHLLGPPPGASGPPQPLWGGSSRLVGARFTPKGSFDSLYLASDPLTAFVEISAVILLPGGPKPVLAPPGVVVSIDGVVTRVLDLTDAATLVLLGTNEQEVSGNWVKLANPPTHALAQAAYDLGTIAGIHYPSAKNPAGTNLVVFPDRLVAAPSDFLEVHDPDGHLMQRLGS